MSCQVDYHDEIIYVIENFTMISYNVAENPISWYGYMISYSVQSKYNMQDIIPQNIDIISYIHVI